MMSVQGNQLAILKKRARASFNANRLPGAFELYRQVLQASRKDIEALQMLGTICQRAGKLADAEQYFRCALRINKRDPELLFQTGSLLLDRKQGKEALELLQESLRYRKNFFEPWLLTGNIHAFSGKIGKAINAYQHAIKINPGHPVPRCNLGNVLADKGDAVQAFVQWRKALELKPDYVEAHSNMLLCMNYGDSLSRSEIFQAHRQWAEQTLVNVRRRDSFPNKADPSKRIRIAYLGPDFREHSVAYFMCPVLSQCNHDEFEVFLYSNVSNPDERTEWFRQQSDHYTSIVAMSDEDIARQIENDEINILVDLAGHTSGNRLPVFGRKPAPVQVSYLGYPNTTGLAEMDYRLTDAYADPEGTDESLYTEKLVRLARGFLCYQPPADAPDVASPPGPEQGYITFGSFNYTAKISARVVATWANILKQVPSSRLLLKYRSYSDAGTREYFLELFKAQGIEPERIQFLGLTLSKKDHLMAYRDVDIALDTFPYNGTTTTCDTLWMGVPVVTLEGEAHAGRVGYSILKHIGLEDLVARSGEDYVRCAVELANDAGRMESLRMALRDRMSGSELCRPVEFVQELELKFREMWGHWCRHHG